MQSRIIKLKNTNKMNIYNTDTKNTVELSYSPTGCDCLRDLSADSGDITYNEDAGRSEADGAAIGWWTNWISQKEQCDAIESALKDELGIGEVDDAVRAACDGVEFGDQPGAIKQALLELASDNGFALKIYDDGSMGFLAL